MQEVEVEVEPRVEESEDQLALRALLASAAGEGDEDFASRKTVIPVTEDEAFQQDIDELPDPATLDNYTDMPVSEFGAAMLRGMGWTGDGKGKKNVQPWLPQSRPALLGIGAKEKEVFDDGSKKKFFGKPDKKYIPVVKKERPTGSSTSSRNRTPSPSRHSGSRRTRSPSPGRNDRTSHDGSQRRDRGDDGKHDRDRDSDRRKDRDRGGERRRHRDDDKDRRRERNEDERRDRDRNGYGRNRDSNKQDRSRDQRERRNDKRD